MENENIPAGEDYYKGSSEVKEPDKTLLGDLEKETHYVSKEDPVKEFKFEPNEPAGDFEPPKWLTHFMSKQYLWFAIAMMFGAMALYSAWEHKQLSLNYNELTSMYNACIGATNPMGVL